MDCCPIEVLRLIIAVLIGDENEGDWSRSPNYQRIRSLRFVDKRISLIASEYLFREVLLGFYAASCEKMVAIARHPIYRTHVRRLCIAQKLSPALYLTGSSLRIGSMAIGI